MRNLKKFVCVFIVLLLVLFCASSCKGEDETSKDQIDIEMIYGRAIARINNASSYVREDRYRTETTQDGVTSVNEQSFIDKFSFDGIGKDSVSFTFPDAEYGEFTLSYCEDVAYVQTASNAFSFDCTFEEFNYFVQRHMYVMGFVTNINVFSMFSYNAVCEKNEQGYYFISISRIIFDENTKEILLGSGYEFYSEISEINLEATIIINPNMYFEEIMTDLTFSANTETGRADFSVHNKVAFSEIGSKTVYVDIPTYNCEHIGDANILAGLDAFNNLNRLPGYSASLTEEYSLSGNDISHKDVVKTDFIIENGKKQKFAKKSVYDCDDTKTTLYLYLEDGVLYSKRNEELEYTDYGDKIGRYRSVDVWTVPWFDINTGKSFSLTAGDGDTATLSYEYDHRLVGQLVSDYLYIFNGEEYMPESLEVVAVEKAAAFVIYDTAKCIVIEQNYEIEATVEIDGNTFTFRVNRTLTVDTDNFTVPDRSVFLGTSDF